MACLACYRLDFGALVVYHAIFLDRRGRNLQMRFGFETTIHEDEQGETQQFDA